MTTIRDIISLLRLPHWAKNLFIFLPIFFGQKLDHLDLLVSLIFLFFGFSLIASSVYVFNDLLDIESDKLHPIKKNRPLAKGYISIKQAVIIIICLLALGFFLINFSSKSITVLILVLTYLIQNLFYTIKLKHIALVDVTIVSIGFVLRVFIGGIAVSIQLSHWIILMTFILAMFLALAKRLDDVKLLKQNKLSIRKSTSGYNESFLNVALSIMSVIIIVTYLMYCTSTEIINRFGENTYLTAFFVILGVFRYLQISLVFEKSGSPTSVLLKDRFTQINLIGWVTTLLIIMYL